MAKESKLKYEVAFSRADLVRDVAEQLFKQYRMKIPAGKRDETAREAVEEVVEQGRMAVYQGLVKQAVAGVAVKYGLDEVVEG